MAVFDVHRDDALQIGHRTHVHQHLPAEMLGDEQAPRTLDQFIVVFRILRQTPSRRRHQLTVLANTFNFDTTNALIHVLLESVMKRPHAATKRIDLNDRAHG